MGDSIAGEKQADASALFDRTEQYRPAEPHWYLSLIGIEPAHRNKGYGGALLRHALRQCDRDHLPAYLWSSNPQNFRFTCAMVSKSPAQSKSDRHQSSFPCYASRAEAAATRGIPADVIWLPGVDRETARSSSDISAEMSGNSGVLR